MSDFVITRNGLSLANNRGLPAKIFEHDYVTDVLGLEIPLHESSPFSNQLRQRIIEEQLLMEGFFGDFSSLAGDIKNATLGLRFMVEVPARVKVFMKDLWSGGIMPLYKKVMSWINIAIGVAKAFMKKHPPLKALYKFAQTMKKVVTSTISKVKSMSGWKQALLGIAAVSGLAFLAKKLMDNSELTDMKRQKNFIARLADTGQITSDEAKTELMALFDKADAAGFGGTSLLDHFDPSLAWNKVSRTVPMLTLTEAVYDTDTSERLDEFLGKMADKVKGALGKGKDKGKDKKSDDKKSDDKKSDDKKPTGGKTDALKEFIAPYMDTVKKIGTGILKSLAIDAALGAISGGVATFWKWIKSTFKNMKLVFDVVGPTMQSFVKKIKDPKKEAEEAMKGEDDPTEKGTGKKDTKSEAVLRNYVRGYLTQNVR